MKIEEAIKEIQERIDIAKKHYAEEVPEYIEALETAIEALEKQIPKKPINDKCENCGEDVRNWTGDDNFKYCPECGTKLDWGKEE